MRTYFLFLFAFILVIASSCTHQSGIEAPVTPTSFKATAFVLNTPTSIPTSIPKSVLGCPRELVDESISDFSGSILFTFSRLADYTSLWSYSSSIDEIYRLDVPGNANLSPDERIMYWIETTSESKTIVIKDLDTNQIYELQIQNEWDSIGWSRSNQLIIKRNRYQDNDFFSYEFIELNPRDINLEDVSWEYQKYSLPDHSVYENNPWMGYISFAPDQQYVVYTPIVNWELITRLLNISDGSIVWEDAAKLSPPIPPAVWAENSSRFAYVRQSVEGEYQILLLSLPNLELIELTEPTTGAVRYMNWSGDGNFLHYSEWKSSSEGPGYIINLNTLEIYEICKLESTFLNGEWIPGDDKFVYRIRLDDGTEELRILDVSDWSTLLISETENNNFHIIRGWSPIELP